MSIAPRLLKFDDVQEKADLLDNLDLPEAVLNEIASRSHAERAKITNNHAVNASGQLVFLEGIRSIKEFAGQSKGDWRAILHCGVEGIFNANVGVFLTYQNVDCACDVTVLPTPPRRKGAAVRSMASQGSFFEPLVEGTYSTKSDFYWLCVDKNGNAELNKPILEDGHVVGYELRIFLGSPRIDFADQPKDGNPPKSPSPVEVDVPVKPKSHDL